MQVLMNLNNVPGSDTCLLNQNVPGRQVQIVQATLPRSIATVLRHRGRLTQWMKARGGFTRGRHAKCRRNLSRNARSGKKKGHRYAFCPKDSGSIQHVPDASVLIWPQTNWSKEIEREYEVRSGLPGRESLLQKAYCLQMKLS